jgi:hypothetical protein
VTADRSAPSRVAEKLFRAESFTGPNEGSGRTRPCHRPAEVPSSWRRRRKADESIGKLHLSTRQGRIIALELLLPQ